LFVMIAWGVADWAQHKHLPTRGLGIPTVLVLLIFSLLTHRQLAYWHASIMLWSHALEVTSRNFVAEDSLGGALVNEGRYDEAIPHFRSAVKINPRDPRGTTEPNRLVGDGPPGARQGRSCRRNPRILGSRGSAALPRNLPVASSCPGTDGPSAGSPSSAR